MRTLPTALCLLLCLLSSAVHASDASDCEDEASRLRREASDVEDAARYWMSADREDASETAQRRRRAQSAAESAYHRASRLVRACTPGIPAQQALAAAMANIKGFLVLRFGESPVTRSRINVVEADLQELARLHAQVQPPDYRLTYAIAEAVFSDSSTK